MAVNLWGTNHSKAMYILTVRKFGTNNTLIFSGVTEKHRVRASL